MHTAKRYNLDIIESGSSGEWYPRMMTAPLGQYVLWVEYETLQTTCIQLQKEIAALQKELAAIRMKYEGGHGK